MNAVPNTLVLPRDEELDLGWSGSGLWLFIIGSGYLVRIKLLAFKTRSFKLGLWRLDYGA